MPQKTFAVIIMALAHPAFTQATPAICHWDPVLSVAAGSELTARISAASARRCLAELSFSDTTYLPITWSFGSPGCAGVETATIMLPKGAPNGDAFVTWDCAGDNTATCIHVSLTNGTANLDGTPIQQTGVVQCSSYPSPTTLITQTSPSSTSSQSISSTIVGAAQTGTNQTLTNNVSATASTATTPGPLDGSGRSLSPTTESSTKYSTSEPIRTTTGGAASAISPSSDGVATEVETAKKPASLTSTPFSSSFGGSTPSSTEIVTVTVTTCVTPPTH